MPVRSWNAHLARFVAGLALVLLIAWLSGAWLIVLALSAAAYAAWQVYNNWRLHQWLADSQREPPESLGIWSDIFDQIDKLEKQNRRHRQRQKETIQEFMSVTNAFPDASLVIDDQDNIKWFNDAARA
ncbi:MAG: DUF3329 domain-containing protein, partial [Xanthomonadales bacterium]|nr:DUF3329 domain-containing protein [Xanthomonadales bacterium]